MYILISDFSGSGFTLINVNPPPFYVTVGLASVFELRGNKSNQRT